MNFKGKLILGVVAILMLSIPVTMYVLQRQQESRSRASASTTLSLSPASPVSGAVGDTISFDVQLTPGTNSVTFVRLQIFYDPTILQLSTTNPFDRNTDVFPVKVEGPVITAGSLVESISIGNDPTKIITAPTIIGKLNFKAIHTTSAPSTISFGSGSLALSSGASDSATQNVISTTSPASVIITAPATPLSPTSTPSATPTLNLTPTATPSPVPTGTPTPTPLPTTRLNIDAILHGIGVGGDNANPSANSLSNKHPMHPTQTASVSLYDSSNILITSASGNIHYSSTSGSFSGLIDVGHLPTDVYTVKVKTTYHLIRRVEQIISIVQDQTNTIPTVTLVTGDVNNDNELSIMDYNLLMDCYSDYAVPLTTCNASKKTAADINDDGSVNGFDYNLFLREIATQQGA